MIYIIYNKMTNLRTKFFLTGFTFVYDCFDVTEKASFSFKFGTDMFALLSQGASLSYSVHNWPSVSNVI